MNKKEIPFRRKLGFLVIIFMSFFLILEGGTRVFYLIKNQADPRDRNFSQKLGWITQENIQRTKIFKGYGAVSYSTTKYGFRVFGNVDTKKKKLFVIGDSQTQAIRVSDGETYFDYIGKKTDSEIFAYGSGGYGSLQEYMILDEFYDIIQPDIILWQFCSNDIYNNSFELESSSWKDNNHMTRPYYRDGKIEYKFPHNSWIYRKILRHSYVIKSFNINLDILLSDNLGAISQHLLSEDNPLFKEALKNTLEIMSLVKKRAGDVPVVAFPACGGTQTIQNKKFADICQMLDIFYISNVLKAIQKAKASGATVNGMPYNAHWNDTAHSIAGETIVEHLLKTGILERRSPDSDTSVTVSHETGRMRIMDESTVRG